jgi:hypothetical protein
VRRTELHVACDTDVFHAVRSACPCDGSGTSRALPASRNRTVAAGSKSPAGVRFTVWIYLKSHRHGCVGREVFILDSPDDN